MGKRDTLPDTVSPVPVGLHALGAGEGERALPQAYPAADPCTARDPLSPPGGSVSLPTRCLAAPFSAGVAGTAQGDGEDRDVPGL